MRNFYEVGKIYVWKNRIGEWSQLNGTETTVIGNVIEASYANNSSRKALAQETDTIFNGNIMSADKYSLRPKNPPSGEKSISEMFSKPYVKELDKEKELEEAYE